MLDPEGPTGGRLEIQGRVPRSVAFIHCVGSRRSRAWTSPDQTASCTSIARAFCCTALSRPPGEVRKRYPKTAVYDLYRDIRTYGRDQEPYYVNASKAGVVFLRFANDARPVVQPAEGRTTRSRSPSQTR